MSKGMKLWNWQFRPIKAGEEIFTYYGYRKDLAPPNDFPWYWDLLKKTEEEEELLKEKEEERLSSQKKTKTKKKKVMSEKFKKS